MQRSQKQMRLKPFPKSLKPGQKVVLGFFLIIVTGTVLLTLPVATVNRESIGLLDAFFTATTSTCVTGLVAVDTGTTFSLFGLTVIMLLIQIGGLGFMAVATMFFLAIGKRITLRERMVIQESLNTDSMSGLVRLMIAAISITFIIEGIGAVLIAIRFVPVYGWGRGIFNSVFLAISMFCNAGIDPVGHYQSLMGYVSDPLMNLTVMTLIILGGLGFSVIREVVQKRKWRALSLHARTVMAMTAGLLIFGMLSFLIMEWNNPDTIQQLPVGDKLLASAFQSTTPRTAGANTIDQASMSGGSKLLTMVLMFIGASPASTGGGIKVTSFACIILATIAVIRGRDDVNIAKRRIAREVIRRAAAIAVMGAMLIAVATFIICMVEPQLSLEAVLFEAFSAFGTVGLSFGITPTLHPISKLVIIVLMFCGRVGPLTLSVALSRKKPGEDLIRYPEGRLMVG